MRKILFIALLYSIITTTLFSCSKDDESSFVGSSWKAEWKEVIGDVTIYNTGTLTFGLTTCTLTFEDESYSSGYLIDSNKQSHTRICSSVDYPTILLIDGNGDITTIVISNNSFTLWNQTYSKM